MLGFIALALGALACMFIIVFSLASGIDRRINE